MKQDKNILNINMYSNSSKLIYLHKIFILFEVSLTCREKCVCINSKIFFSSERKTKSNLSAFFGVIKFKQDTEKEQK